MDERELERRLRAGLGARAEDPDVTVLVADGVATRVRRRRQARWGAAAAAAAVVAIIGGVVVIAPGNEPTGERLPAATDPTDDLTAATPDGWRTEYWHGLAVDVPGDWGYGGAPMPDGSACYPAALRAADGARLSGDGDVGWVGRPILQTDVCASYPWIENSPQQTPTAPYVWLGAAVDPGSVTYENGYVQETVTVEGTTLTVASDDADLRQQVLDSARPGELCAASYGDTAPSPSGSRGPEGDDSPASATVCAYRSTTEDCCDYHLTYAAPLDPAAAVEAHRIQARAPEVTHDDQCYGDFSAIGIAEQVVVEARYGDGAEPLRAVVDLLCAGQVHLGAGLPTRLQPEAVELWAVGGMPATVLGPTDPDGDWVYRYFIGMQG